MTLTQKVGGAILGVIGSVAAAWIIGVPSMVVSAMDNHNDERYVAVEQNNAQMYQQGIQRFNEREDTLEWRKLKAEDATERQLLELQQKRLQNDKELFEKQYGK